MSMGKIIKRSIFFSVIILNTALMAQPGGSLYFQDRDILAVKKEIQEGNTETAPFVALLKELAGYYLKSGPWSVTDTPGPAVSGDPHDYFSESPYWWPDPVDPTAPYIRKDGQRNPDRFMAHKEALNSMTQAVLTLGMASFFLDDPSYSQKARQIIRVWFLDEKTRMNPHLNYAQAVRNKSPGRGVGIIDSRRFMDLIEGVYFLDRVGGWPGGERETLQGWFSQYLNWMNTSPNGLDEKGRNNNHAVWWCAQAAAYAQFTGDHSFLKELWPHFRQHVLNKQITGEGRLPEEEARTRSFSYMEFNLTALTMTSRMAERTGVEFWRYKNPRGGSIEMVLDNFLPYLSNPDNWPYEQITKPGETEPVYLLLAGQSLQNDKYLQFYKEKRRTRSGKKHEKKYNALNLYFNLISTQY